MRWRDLIAAGGLWRQSLLLGEVFGRADDGMRSRGSPFLDVCLLAVRTELEPTDGR